MTTQRHMFVSTQTVILLTLLFAFANCLACIHAGSFPQPGSHHQQYQQQHPSNNRLLPYPLRHPTFLSESSFRIDSSSSSISSSSSRSAIHSSRGGSIYVAPQEASSNSSTAVLFQHDNETTAFRYSADLEPDNHSHVVPSQRGLKVLFLSADTGGGHRASAESLANQFLKQFPGSEYDLLDVWTPTKVYPYYTLVPSYKYLSAHPQRWKALYYISNTRWYEKITNAHSSMTCYHKIKKQLEEYDPDVVVSVHPTMNYLPEKIIREIAKSRNKYVPFFTVVTDFGSGHCTWFQGTVDKMYVASERIKSLAKRRGAKVKDENLVMSGLPIRDDFARLAEMMNGRATEHGKMFRKEIKAQLGLDPEKRVVLVMGGGEGVGSLGVIAQELYLKLRSEGVDASICVVCGRNDKVKRELENKDWDAMYEASKMSTGDRKVRRIQKISNLLHRRKSQKQIQSVHDDNHQYERDGQVNVVCLGFVSNMAEYMVASDVLVSKAGPGTIAEAAAVGLPVMITSFLPGQEAGNVNIVLDGGFGAFEKKPPKIAEKVSSWLRNDALLDEMSIRSEAVGNPHAASDIVRDIGQMTWDILERNHRNI